MSPSATAIVITGASRGFGRALALVVAKEYIHGDFKLILVARSTEGLEETSRLAKENSICHQDAGTSSNIVCCSMDLGDLEMLDVNLDELVRHLEAALKIIFIQNAGEIGHLGPCRNSPGLKEMQENLNLNVTSCLWMSSRLVKFAREFSKELVLINISSLVAIADFPTFGIYSTGKAARDKYHTLIAKEEEADRESKVRTLNYAPGPLETDMVQTIRASMKDIDASLQGAYQQKQLDPMDSARKLVALLQRDQFESGSHVDFYDLPDVSQ